MALVPRDGWIWDIYLFEMARREEMKPVNNPRETGLKGAATWGSVAGWMKRAGLSRLLVWLLYSVSEYMGHGKHGETAIGTQQHKGRCGECLVRGGNIGT